MEWDEAVNHIRVLRADPSSMLAAAMEGWEHPVSREALALYDVWELLLAVNTGSKSPKPHPARPGKPPPDRQHMGDVKNRSDAQVRALLAAFRDGRPPV